jgi:hypothetical protein
MVALKKQSSGGLDQLAALVFGPIDPFELPWVFSLHSRCPKYRA